jgi:hypothetical protein
MGDNQRKHNHQWLILGVAGCAIGFALPIPMASGAGATMILVTIVLRAAQLNMVVQWFTVWGAKRACAGFAVDNRGTGIPSPVPTQNCELSGKPGDLACVIAVRRGGMITVLSALFSMLSFRFRNRASLSLELEFVALRHQLPVLRRQGPRCLQLHSTNALL